MIPLYAFQADGLKRLFPVDTDARIHQEISAQDLFMNMRQGAIAIHV